MNRVSLTVGLIVLAVPTFAFPSAPPTDRHVRDEIVSATCRLKTGDRQISNATLLAGTESFTALRAWTGNEASELSLASMSRIDLDAVNARGLVPARVWMKGAANPIRMTLVVRISDGKRLMPLHLVSKAGRAGGDVAIQDCRSITFTHLEL